MKNVNVKRQLSFASGLLVLAFGVLLGCGADPDAAKPPGMTQVSATLGDPDSNERPLVEGVVLRPVRPVPGREVRAQARVLDPDGDRTTVRYAWRTARGRALGVGQTFDTTGLAEGQPLEVVAIASDGDLDSEQYVHEFRLAEPSVEIALVAIDPSDGAKPGTILEAVVESTDEEVGGYAVLLSWEVDGTVMGTGEWIDTSPLDPGDGVILVARLDFGDRVTRPVRSRPVILSRGEPPTISSEPLALFRDGLFRYQVLASSPEPGAKLFFEIQEGPAGMTIHERSGLVEWRPELDQRGDFEVEIVAVDQWGTGVAQSFVLTLDDPASPPASAR